MSRRSALIALVVAVVLILAALALPGTLTGIVVLASALGALALAVRVAASRSPPPTGGTMAWVMLGYVVVQVAVVELAIHVRTGETIKILVALAPCVAVGALVRRPIALAAPLALIAVVAAVNVVAGNPCTTECESTTTAVASITLFLAVPAVVATGLGVLAGVGVHRLVRSGPRPPDERAS